MLVKEIFSDGLGACLDVCPTGALKIVERDSADFDPKAAVRHVLKTRGPEAAARGKTVSGRSELSQWPIQLHLVSPVAPYFKNADLLVAADCTAFSLGSFHPDLLRGKKLVIACPKLDDPSGYVEKLADLIKQNDLNSLTVAIMTVPCCSGLAGMVDEAVEASGVEIFPNKVVVGIDGGIVA